MSDLTPRDGLSNVWFEFYGLERALNGTDWHAKFRFILKEGEHEHFLSALSVEVSAADDGPSGLIARAHDEVIGILRQALHTADILRTHYKSETERYIQARK